MEKRLYNIKEAAAYLGIAAPTLKMWRKSGVENIPCIRLGSRLLFDKCDLDAFVESKKSENKEGQ